MKQGLQYYEFYLMHNEFVVNATIVADVFLNVPVSEFNVGILKVCDVLGPVLVLIKHFFTSNVELFST